MSINIPQKLRKRLKDDNNKWQRRVENLIDTLEPILVQSPEFFPQYTDHGLSHVNTVLDLAAKLIHSKSLRNNALTSRDVACLVAAILIHDLGMFLTPDGLTMLMMPEWDQHRLQELDGLSWSDAWEQYIASAKRMPEERMLRCFGKQIRVEDTTLDQEKMVQDDKLVIGEFLRRNHSRLAYEIAVSGLPGSVPQKLLEASGFDKTDCSVIGLIARSHGMYLREVEDYLGSNAYHSNLPVYYLMSVLRLADYLDASEKRAPMVRLKQEALTSPLSQEEWALNQCFKIDSSRCDSETKNYTINATPNTSSEYARLEKWLQEVQSELDQCWAILSEKYPNSKLKLSIHRIKCTMYEKLNYSNLSSRILPREVKVTANPEIVKLMVEPLYGDDPSYGVRELLQNAVDACLEREQWEKNHGNSNYKGLVDVRIENGTFTITDNGMGMNEDVLLNYYLSAGASYRSSDAWMAANAPDGKSQVARTGRFGVGFLASFLLGNEVEVLTHHRDDQMGYHFFFDQDSKPLDVKRLVQKEYGTTITIKLKPGVYDKLQKGLDPKKEDSWYMWYAFDDPMVTYHFDGKLVSSPHETIPRIPDANCSWFRLDSKQYENYLWAYKKSQKFFCNGLYIPHYRQFRPVRMGADHGLSLDAPSVSLMDPNGSLQVNLQRTSVLTFPEESTLLQELYRYVIAGLLVSKWDYSLGCRIFHNDWIPCLQRPGGFLPNHPAFRSTAKVTRFLALCFCDGIPYDCGSEAPILPHFLTEDIPFMLLSPASFFSRNLTNRFEHQIPYLLKPFVINSGMDTYFDYQSVGVNYWLSQKAYACLHNDSFFESRLDTHLVESDAVFEDSVFKWRLADLPLETSLWSYAVTKGIDQTSRMTLEFFAERRAAYSACQMPIDPTQYPSDQFAFAVDCVTHDQNPDHPSLFSEMLSRYLGPDPWIPYSLEERESKFPDAFTELRPYIDYCKAHPYS